MQKRNLDNRELDTIGRKLLESTRLTGGEIESVISEPGLFEKINARIAVENEASSPASFIGRLSWRTTAAFAGVALIAAFTFGIFGLFRPAEPTKIVSKTQTPVALPESARSEAPPKVLSINPTPDRVSYIEGTRERAPMRTAVKTVYRQAQPDIEPEDDFYPLPVAGDGDAFVGGGHVVRAQVSRSSLFALGANVPLENESKMVNADILIGPDGVPRGIRIVR